MTVPRSPGWSQDAGTGLQRRKTNVPRKRLEPFYFPRAFLQVSSKPTQKRAKGVLAWYLENTSIRGNLGERTSSSFPIEARPCHSFYTRMSHWLRDPTFFHTVCLAIAESNRNLVPQGLKLLHSGAHLFSPYWYPAHRRVGLDSPPGSSMSGNPSGPVQDRPARVGTTQALFCRPLRPPMKLRGGHKQGDDREQTSEPCRPPALGQVNPWAPVPPTEPCPHPPVPALAGNSHLNILPETLLRVVTNLEFFEQKISNTEKFCSLKAYIPVPQRNTALPHPCWAPIRGAIQRTVEEKTGHPRARPRLQLSLGLGRH